MDMTGLQYVCAGGETFESIARGLFDDEKYAAELMCVNPELCNLSVFTGGEEVLIPVIDTEADENQTPTKAPWKEG